MVEMAQAEGPQPQCLRRPEHTERVEIHPKTTKAAMAAVLGASPRLWGALGWVGEAGATGGTCRHCSLLPNCYL